LYSKDHIAWFTSITDSLTERVSDNVGEVQSAALDVLENLATDKDAARLISWD